MIIVNYSSELGFNDIKYPFSYAQEIIYFMLHQKDIPVQEYENSTEKNEYQSSYKKDNELQGDNIENEGIVDDGDDFISCKIFHSKQ